MGVEGSNFVAVAEANKDQDQADDGAFKLPTIGG